MNLADLQEYYNDQLIIQYQDKPKARQTIQCLVNRALCDGLGLQIFPSFNLNTASGAQLTTLGELIGVPRNIYGLDLQHTFFNWTRYSGSLTSIGYGRYANQPDPDLWTRYITNAIYVATDFELLSLIKLRIIYNNFYESLGIIYPQLYGYFKTSIQLVDNKDFTITYNVQNPYHTVATIASFLGNIFPKPAGVGITVNLI